MSRTAHWMFALLLSAAASAQADEAAAPAELPPRQLDGDGSAVHWTNSSSIPAWINANSSAPPSTH